MSFITGIKKINCEKRLVIPAEVPWFRRELTSFNFIKLYLFHSFPTGCNRNLKNLENQLEYFELPLDFLYIS